MDNINIDEIINSKDIDTSDDLLVSNSNLEDTLKLDINNSENTQEIYIEDNYE